MKCNNENPSEERRQKQPTCDYETSVVSRNVQWTRERIYDVSLLNDGDHIAWHRCGPWWHHGIFSKSARTDCPGNNALVTHVLEYSMITKQECVCCESCCYFKILPCCGCCGCCTCVEFQKRKYTGVPFNDGQSCHCGSCSDSFLYRINYEECYPADYVIERAKALCEKNVITFCPATANIQSSGRRRALQARSRLTFAGKAHCE